MGGATGRAVGAGVGVGGRRAAGDGQVLPSFLTRGNPRKRKGKCTAVAAAAAGAKQCAAQPSCLTTYNLWSPPGTSLLALPSGNSTQGAHTCPLAVPEGRVVRPKDSNFQASNDWPATWKERELPLPVTARRLTLKRTSLSESGETFAPGTLPATRYDDPSWDGLAGYLNIVFLPSLGWRAGERHASGSGETARTGIAHQRKQRNHKAPAAADMHGAMSCPAVFQESQGGSEASVSHLYSSPCSHPTVYILVTSCSRCLCVLLSAPASCLCFTDTGTDSISYSRISASGLPSRGDELGGPRGKPGMKGCTKRLHMGDGLSPHVTWRPCRPCITGTPTTA